MVLHEASHLQRREPFRLARSFLNAMQVGSHSFKQPGLQLSFVRFDVLTHGLVGHSDEVEDALLRFPSQRKILALPVRIFLGLCLN